MADEEMVAAAAAAAAAATEEEEALRSPKVLLVSAAEMRRRQKRQITLATYVNVVRAVKMINARAFYATAHHCVHRLFLLLFVCSLQSSRR